MCIRDSYIAVANNYTGSLPYLTALIALLQAATATAVSYTHLADADAGIELDPVVVLQHLAVDDDGRLELGRVAAIFADFLVDLFDVDEVVRVDLQPVILEIRDVYKRQVK